MREPFISVSKMGTARHGDVVLLHIDKVRRDGRSEAAVISVLKRTTQQLGGTYHLLNGQHTVSPDDSRFPFTIIVSPPKLKEISDGDAVIVSSIRQAGIKPENLRRNYRDPW